MMKLILALAFVCGVRSQYYTSDQRTTSVEHLCSRFADRGELVDHSAKQKNEGYRNFIDNQLTADGNQLILDLLEGNKTPEQTFNEQTKQLILFVVPFAIGLVVIILIWVFLCCCCCCPSCCPSKCCQKSEEQAYSKCQLLWPTITLLVALLVVVAMSIIGITKAQDTVTSYQAMTCSAMICLDDLINGNITQTGQFFIGLVPMQKMLVDLRDNHLATIQASLDTIDSSSGTYTKQASDKGSTLMNDISEIPTGTAGQSKSSFTYNNFDGSAGTISSTFPANLGGVTAVSGKIWNTYSQVELTNLKVLVVMQASDAFGASIPTFTSGISDALQSLQDVIDQLQDTDQKAYDILKQGVKPMEYLSLGITIIFAVFLGVSVLGIVGAVVMGFCGKLKCRYLVYFSCSLLFFLGLLALIVAIVFSVVTPLLYYSCEFLNYSVDSGENFSKNFASFIGEDTTQKIKICMPGESGEIISTVVPQIYDTLDSMQTVINGMKDYNTLELLSTLDSRWNSLANLIEGNYRSTSLDWSSSTNKNILKNMANPAFYSGCNSNSFGDDSWIPSIEAGATISCLSNIGVEVDDTDCDATALVGGQNNAPGTCYGCIDTFLVLGQSPSTISTDLKARYTGGGTCDSFADDMQTLWNNYYSVKVTQWDTSGLNTRYATAKTNYEDPTTGYYALVNTVGTTFTNIMDSWTGGIESITDTDYGLVAGLNCLIFGQDFKTFINTTCVRWFNFAYILRYTAGVSGLAILFAMCCATCSGVRHYKHGERNTKVKALQKDRSDKGLESSMAKLHIHTRPSKRDH